MQGICVLSTGHTTAGLTVNENSDPDVIHDLIYLLERVAPWDDPHYRHYEGNSAAHLKSSLMGTSLTLIVDQGSLVLGAGRVFSYVSLMAPGRARCTCR